VAGKGLLTPRRRVGDGLVDGEAVVAEIKAAVAVGLSRVAAPVEVGRGCGRRGE
jgi:hypothetical protein